MDKKDREQAKCEEFDFGKHTSVMITTNHVSTPNLSSTLPIPSCTTTSRVPTNPQPPTTTTTTNPLMSATGGVTGAIGVPSDEVATETPCNGVLVLEYAESGGAVLLNDEIVELEVTMDSGSIVNVLHPEDLPAGCEVEKRATTRNFVGANGGVIENHGYADTNMTAMDDKGPEIRCRWDCAEVTRPLISTGMTCDSGYEVLHTKDAAVVVPAGALSSMLGSINVVQKYTRTGKGLYTTRMKMRAPKIPAAGFTRQSRQP